MSCTTEGKFTSRAGTRGWTRAGESTEPVRIRQQSRSGGFIYPFKLLLQPLLLGGSGGRVLPNTLRLKMLLAPRDGWDTSWEAWLAFIWPQQSPSDACCVTALEG